MSEQELVEHCASYFKTGGHMVAFEVHNMGQSIDMVALRKDNALGLSFYNAFEAKLHDWKKGIKQCQAHLLVAEYVWLVMAAGTESRNLRIMKELAETTIGFIEFDMKEGYVNTHIEAKYNTGTIWEPQQDRFHADFIHSLRHGCTEHYPWDLNKYRVRARRV